MTNWRKDVGETIGSWLFKNDPARNEIDGYDFPLPVPWDGTLWAGECAYCCNREHDGEGPGWQVEGKAHEVIDRFLAHMSLASDDEHPHCVMVIHTGWPWHLMDPKRKDDCEPCMQLLRSVGMVP